MGRGGPCVEVRHCLVCRRLVDSLITIERAESAQLGLGVQVAVRFEKTEAEGKVKSQRRKKNKKDRNS